jgi:prephenate dehydrogenase
MVIEFWREIGGVPIELDAGEHDRVVAYASHMPHLLSALIAKVTLGNDNEAHGMACATGFRDITRVASGGIDMWREISTNNRQAIGEALDVCMTELEQLRKHIEAGDGDAIAEFLALAKNSRDQWLAMEGKNRGFE